MAAMSEKHGAFVAAINLQLLETTARLEQATISSEALAGELASKTAQVAELEKAKSAVEDQCVASRSEYDVLSQLHTELKHENTALNAQNMTLQSTLDSTTDKHRQASEANSTLQSLLAAQSAARLARETEL